MPLLLSRQVTRTSPVSARESPAPKREQSDEYSTKGT